MPRKKITRNKKRATAKKKVTPKKKTARKPAKKTVRRSTKKSDSDYDRRIKAHRVLVKSNT